MSAPQSSTPYSLRLPTKLAQLIDQFATKIGKPAPDTVRAGIEAAFANEYRILALDAANADRAGTLRTLRGAVAEADGKAQLPLPVYSGLMYFLHWAYLHAGVDSYANPRYVIAMLDVIGDLMALGKSMRFTGGHEHAFGCLGIQGDEGLADGIKRIQQKIQNGLATGYAEMLTRPLETMADDLQHLDSAEVANIFAPHLKTLLPVAVQGAKMGVEEDIIRRDMAGIFPETEQFKIDTMNWWLYGKEMTLVVSEGHHTNAFGSHAVLSLYTALECGALGDVLAVNGECHVFSRGMFELTRVSDHVVMHTKGGYRLSLSVEEAQEFVCNLASAFNKPAWRTMVTRYRELKGDI